MSINDIEIDESKLDEYEEVQDALARYNESAAKLIELIGKRDEMAALLKIAQPSKIAEVRECVAEWNELIEFTENMMVDELQLIEKSRDLVRHYLKLEAFLDVAQPEFLKYIAEHQPEKLEHFQALFEDDSDAVTH